MQSWSDSTARLARLLKALSDLNRIIIIETLATGKFESGFKVKEMCDYMKLERNLVYEYQNLYKHLRSLEDAELLKHGSGVRSKWEHDQWFPIPKEVYQAILDKLDELGRLADIGSSITGLAEVFADIKTTYRLDPVQNKYKQSFCEKLMPIFNPSSFKLMTPALVWKVFKMATDQDVDIDPSTLV